MERIFEIHGYVTTDRDISHDDFWEAFIQFVETENWTYFGMTKDVTEAVAAEEASYTSNNEISE